MLVNILPKSVQNVVIKIHTRVQSREMLNRDVKMQGSE